MSNKSWTVTLIPLIIAILQFAEIKLSGRTPTESDLQMLYAAVTAYIGSGAIGAFLAVFKSRT